MDTVTLLIIISSQVFILLLGVIGFLAFLLRRAKRYKHNLLEKTQQAIREAEELALRQIAEMENQLNEGTGSIEDYLDEAINTSINEFEAKGGNQLNYSKDLNKDQLIAWLRYQLLKAEKGNLKHQEGDIYWQQLQDQFTDLLSVHNSAALGESSQKFNELKEAKTIIEERVSNIEYHWSEAQSDGHNIFQKVINLCATLPNGEQIVRLITDYHNQSLKLGSLITNEEYNPIDSARYLENGTGGSKTQTKEIERLKTVNENQHQLIVQLKDKLKSFRDSDDPGPQIEEYEQQLSELERLLRETDMCITTLESELESAQEKIKNLEKQGNNASKDDDKSEYVNNIVEKFAHESRDLIATIRKLEMDLSAYKESYSEEPSEKHSDPGLDSLLEQADQLNVNNSMPGIDESDSDIDEDVTGQELQSSLSAEDIQELLDDDTELDEILMNTEEQEPDQLEQETPQGVLADEESADDDSADFDLSDMQLERISENDEAEHSPPRDILAEISAEDTVSADDIDDLLESLDDALPDSSETSEQLGRSEKPVQTGLEDEFPEPADGLPEDSLLSKEHRSETREANSDNNQSTDDTSLDEGAVDTDDLIKQYSSKS